MTKTQYMKSVEADEQKSKRWLAKGHFAECYLVRYPSDEGVHCTCLDYSPEC